MDSTLNLNGKLTQQRKGLINNVVDKVNSTFPDPVAVLKKVQAITHEDAISCAAM